MRSVTPHNADPIAAAIIDAARSCIGTPFRLQGRDPSTGLDCVGLVAFAYRSAGAELSLPRGYALRGGSLTEIETRTAASGFVSVPPNLMGIGDLILAQPGPRQRHLMIHSGAGFIHAHLALRRTVETPGSPPWPIAGCWRWRPYFRERRG